MHARRIVALGLLLLTAGLADPAGACDRRWPVRRGLPRRVQARVVGVVSGYSVAPPSLGALSGVPVLLLRVDEVVSGALARGDVQVVATITGPGCRTVPATRTVLEQTYAIGTAVVASGEARRAPLTRAGAVVVADEAKGGFVQAVPSSVVRTSAGDLDFARFDANQPGAWAFVEFEFDRAALTLGRSRPRERIARVENLAAYPGFAHTPAARFMYRNLVVASGAPVAERDRLLRAFEERIGKP